MDTAIVGATLLPLDSWVERSRSATFDPGVEETGDSVWDNIHALAGQAITGN